MIETDTLSLLFIGCFLVGFLYMLLTAFMGGGPGSHSLVHHVHIGTPMHHSIVAHGAHQGNSGGGSHFNFLPFVNPTSLAFFLLGFGFFGYIFHNLATAMTISLTILLAAICGITGSALLLMMLGRIFGDSESATIQDVSDRTGIIGKVSMTIQERGLGEIIYVSPGGMRKSVPARSVDGRRLERDQEVVVVNFQKGIAEVDTWNHFVNQEDSIFQSQGSGDLATLRMLLEETNNTDSEYITRYDPQKE